MSDLLSSIPGDVRAALAGLVGALERYYRMRASRARPLRPEELNEELNEADLAVQDAIDDLSAVYAASLRADVPAGE